MKTQSIQIVFPVEVELPEGFTRALDGLIDMVCKKYQAENPDRVMWPAGSGSKPLFNWMTVGDDEPLPFDDSVYFVEVAEREDYHGHNPHNPKAEELQKAVNERIREKRRRRE